MRFKRCLLALLLQGNSVNCRRQIKQEFDVGNLIRGNAFRQIAYLL